MRGVRLGWRGAYGSAGFGCRAAAARWGLVAQFPAPLRSCSHPRHDGPFTARRATTAAGRTARHDGPLAAYGAKGTGWGVSARSGRRPLPSPAQGTEPPDRGIQGRGELRKTRAPTKPADEPEPAPVRPPEATV